MNDSQNADSAAARWGLLLDLDGTIADTLKLCFDSYRYAVAPWVDRELTDAEVEATFGPPERECLAAMAPRASLDEAEARFHAFYEAEHQRVVQIVDGMSEVIERARGLGWPVGVFTGKGRRGARFTLRELGLLDRVEPVISGDDVPQPKPAPDGIFQASAAWGIPPSRILMAGDSPVDVQAGRSAGARTAAVLWATFQPDRLRTAGADYICERVEELDAVIEGLHSGRLYRG